MTAECFVGELFESPSVGDEQCNAEFGEGWSWLEFHDGENNGWNAKGSWLNANGAGQRAWVWIDDKPGNCWQSDYAMTWYRAEGESCIANCIPDTGLEGPEYKPFMGKCNPSGDTPCDFCRPILCFSE